jgi:hypothetical protein
MALKREEQKLILEIKAAAKTNNQAAMRVLAKSLVRLRGQMAKLQGSQANLRGVSTNLTTAAASTTVAQSMGTATAAMSKMQQQMNPAKVRMESYEAAVPPAVLLGTTYAMYTTPSQPWAMSRRRYTRVCVHNRVKQSTCRPIEPSAACNLHRDRWGAAAVWCVCACRSTRRCSSLRRRMRAWR